MMALLGSNDPRDSSVATMCLPRNDIKIEFGNCIELSGFGAD
jgi:hypothetical protein